MKPSQAHPRKQGRPAYTNLHAGCVAYTMEEILQMEYQYAGAPFNIPCYFGMSINDDILNYDLTEQIVEQHFQQITIQKYSHPYHQPPEPPTFEWLNREFGQFLEMIG